VKSVTPRAQLDQFIDKYSPEVAKHARAAFAALRRRLPAAHVLVYENYNALAIGFGPTLSKGKRGALIIKSISAKQRSRRPAAAP
jgi:hypothetical protein